MIQKDVRYSEKKTQFVIETQTKRMRYLCYFYYFLNYKGLTILTFVEIQ